MVLVRAPSACATGDEVGLECEKKCDESVDATINQ